MLLLNGSSGFLGPHVLRGLSVSGYPGLAVARRELRSPLPTGWSFRTRAEILTGPPPVGGIGTVLHLEVKQHVLHPTAADLAEFEAVNVWGTEAWLAWCTRHDVLRFVFFSSIKAVCAASEGPTREDAPGPYPSPYGASKWAAEERVRAWVAADPRRSALVLRPAVIYGPGTTANIAAMVNGIRKGRFFLIGRNDNVKSLVAVGNVVAAVAFLLPRMQPGRCEVYHLADAESLSVRDLDARLRALLGLSGNSPSLPVPLACLAAKAGDVVHRVTVREFPINSSRLAALRETTHFPPDKLLATGFRPPLSVDAGLRELVKGLSS